MGAQDTIRAVFDTNVVVSALLFRKGSLSYLRELWRSSRLTPLVARATVEELLQVLSYSKFKLAEEERKALLEDYLPYAEIVSLPPHPVDLPQSRDPDDQVFLDLAAVGGARLLVTGDGDLLALAGKTSFDIVTPAQLRLRLGDDKEA